MTAFNIALIPSPEVVEIPLRELKVNASLKGQATSEYLEAVILDSMVSRRPLLYLKFFGGAPAIETVAASAIDGIKIVLLYNFGELPLGALRAVDIIGDVVLNLDLNDGSGGGSGVPTDAASTSAIVKVDKLPADREIVLIEKASTGEWRLAGSQILQGEGLLELQVTGGQVFAVGLDDYGRPFQSGLTLEVGQAIRPGNFQGWLYRCTESGTLPENEPDWWLEQGENPPRLVGTARLQAIRYYQPIAHGPIHYELI